jgi:hypothetical protein
MLRIFDTALVDASRLVTGRRGFGEWMRRRAGVQAGGGKEL